MNFQKNFEQEFFYTSNQAFKDSNLALACKRKTGYGVKSGMESWL